MTSPKKPKTKPERRVRGIVRTKTSLADQLQHITPEWRDRLISYCANQGDFSPLTDALLYDIELGPMTRAFLIEDFESGKPRKRGNKRSWAQISNDVEIFLKVAFTMVDNQIKLSAATTEVAKKLNMARTTIASIVERTAPSLPEIMPVMANGRWVMSCDSANEED